MGLMVQDLGGRAGRLAFIHHPLGVTPEGSFSCATLYNSQKIQRKRLCAPVLKFHFNGKTAAGSLLL